MILSDVVGDDLSTIASGPTVGDTSTFSEALMVIDHFGLTQSCPPDVIAHLKKGISGGILETPQPNHISLARCHSLLIANNAMCLEACKAKARELDYHTRLISSRVQGESKEIAKCFAGIAKELRRGQTARPLPACVIFGGETTVTLSRSGTAVGTGKGGRNQELALSAAIELAGESQVAVVSLGTDGTDGPTDAAGAIAFGDSLSRADEKGLDAKMHLERHDAYNFFDAIGDFSSHYGIFPGCGTQMPLEEPAQRPAKVRRRWPVRWIGCF